MSYSVAMLSVHTSPLANPGSTKDAGGMNVYIQELARELGHRDTTVDIFTRWTNEQMPRIVYLSKQVRVIHIQAGPLAPIHKDDLYQYLPTFVQHIAEFQRTEAVEYDVIHSHYWLSGVAAAQLAKRWDVPHITMFHTLGRLKQLANPHESEPPLRLEMEQHLVQQADRIIAATTEERTQLVRYFGISSNRIQVVPCGVNLNLFASQNKQQARKKFGLNAHMPILLFVGRLDPFKGPDLFLRAASLMETPVHLVIVGGSLHDDPDLQGLQELARDLNIHQHTHFLGARPQSELPSLYSAADVTVVPSFHESFGMVAVESLACGTPVVATRAGGLLTVVKNNETGYLVPRCPGFFAERLDTLLSDRALLAQMQLAARPSILQFSWSSVASQINQIYDEVIDEQACLVAQ